MNYSMWQKIKKTKITPHNKNICKKIRLCQELFFNQNSLFSYIIEAPLKCEENRIKYRNPFAVN